MEFCSLTSGSSGNCLLVGSETTYILVDVGISKKRVCQQLEAIHRQPEEIQGIFVTHEHSDHIQGIGVFVRKYPVPIYGTYSTLEALKNNPQLGKIDPSLYQVIEPDKPVMCGDLTINATRIWHDAADPVCYQIYQGDKKVSICTDLGDYYPHLTKQLQDSHVLFLEANHDVNMLLVGPYAYPLKQRILGSHGHLSNERCSEFLDELIHTELKKIYLGHLSIENNIPELAYETIALALRQGKHGIQPEDVSLEVANRYEHSSYFVF